MRANLIFLSICALLCSFAISTTAQAQSPGLVGVITNQSVLLTWPMLPGKWELSSKSVAGGEWQVIPEDKYETNRVRISATLPLAPTAMLYRIRRTMALTVPTLPHFPAVPPPPTNRPPPRPNMAK